MGGEGGVRTDALTNVKSLMYQTDKNNMPHDLRNLERVAGVSTLISGLNETKNLSPFFCEMAILLGLLPIKWQLQ